MVVFLSDISFPFQGVTCVKSTVISKYSHDKFLAANCLWLLVLENWEKGPWKSWKSPGIFLGSWCTNPVEGSLQISYAACQHTTSKYMKSPAQQQTPSSSLVYQVSFWISHFCLIITKPLLFPFSKVLCLLFQTLVWPQSMTNMYNIPYITLLIYNKFMRH